MQFLFTHKLLGNVKVTRRQNARHFIARHGVDCVELTAPAAASSRQIAEALDSLAPQLLEKKATPGLRFSHHQVIDLYGLTVEIDRQSVRPDALILSQYAEDKGVISVGCDLDFESTETTQMISNGLKRFARRNAPWLLLPRAKALSERHHCRPSGWQISSGTRTLGQCNGEGIIKLSYMNMFLTPELRDYVVCHELAHLSELNHSPRFHKVCDAYLEGREKELMQKLKSFHWPILR